MDIFQMSFANIFLIITVVVIRVLTLHKLPKRIFLVLWGIVICRLLIPFSIPSRFSFYTGIDLLKRTLSETTAFTNPVRMAGFVIHSTGYNIEIDEPAVLLSPVTIIWLIGVCSCALFFIVTYIKCRREFRTSLPVENDFTNFWLREQQMRRTVQIRQCDKIKVPLTYGVFHPVILMPKSTDWTDETKLRYILTHEFVHIRRFDTLVKLLLIFPLCLHWFNPLVWVMCVLANRDIELSCDETVVRIFGESVKSAYVMMLIGMEEKKNRLTPLCNNFSKNAIEERIVSIMKMKKTSLVGMIVALALVIGTTTVFATNAAVPMSDPCAKDLFTASSEQNNSSEETEMKISMITVQNTYPSSTEKVNVIITNNTSIEYYTDMDYSIEYYNGSVWSKIPLEFGINDVLIFLLPKESKEFSIYLYPEQYHYQSGKYRICKTYSSTAFSSTEGKYKLTTQFNIQ